MRVLFQKLLETPLCRDEHEIGTINDCIIEEKYWSIQQIGIGLDQAQDSHKLLISPLTISISGTNQDPQVQTILSEQRLAKIPDFEIMESSENLFSLQSMIGYHLLSIDDPLHEFGKVEGFIVDTIKWAVTEVIANTHKWMPFGKLVSFSPMFIRGIEPARKVLHVVQSHEEFDIQANPIELRSWNEDVEIPTIYS